MIFCHNSKGLVNVWSSTPKPPVASLPSTSAPLPQISFYASVTVHMVAIEYTLVYTMM